MLEPSETRLSAAEAWAGNQQLLRSSDSSERALEKSTEERSRAEVVGLTAPDEASRAFAHVTTLLQRGDFEEAERHHKWYRDQLPTYRLAMDKLRMGGHHYVFKVPRKLTSAERLYVSNYLRDEQEDEELF
ncbi:hypothetical protein DL770_010447 [Monosporascus sp. CRB-9-2]|nr:hypothetical protein DL770_010447 [Monosporascus sp. CRB-9-2]